MAKLVAIAAEDPKIGSGGSNKVALWLRWSGRASIVPYLEQYPLFNQRFSLMINKRTHQGKSFELLPVMLKQFVKV